VSFSPLLVLLVGAIAFGAFYVVNAAAASRRREALFAAATLRGWTFSPELPELASRWDGHPFGQGDNRRARDVLSGRWHDTEFVAFTYSYETSSTDSKGVRHTTTSRFGVVARSLPAWLPTLEIRPENILHRAVGAIGLGSDIELESEDFNRAFRVSSSDPKYASDMLPPRAMEELLAAPHLPWRIEGASILTWQDATLDPDVVESRLAALDAVISGIPTFVWKDHGYDPPTESLPA
jgi:Protein of unknown function (DUF3137)